jgi:hypothetical protein
MRGRVQMYDIDFVIMWVDGSDPKWIKEKLKYQMNTEVPDELVADTAKCFRDWGILQYWFRGVEKFAPWVRKIHFVTYGHLPKWLNVNNEKLHIVTHKDFMPDGSLPTFNSRALEINLFRIPDLQEHFVYFNDDMFLLREVSPADFFVNGRPCDCSILSPIYPARFGTAAIQVNDTEIINDYFHGFQMVKSNFGKWINPKYGVQLLRTLMFYPLHQMFGIYEPHTPVSYLKSTYETVWEKEPEVLMNTSCSRFKKKDNVNQWLMRYWQLASGNFVPRSPKFGKYFDLGKQCPDICDAIKKQSRHMICINDNADIDNVENVERQLTDAFNTILPEKSGFEI